MPIRIELRTNVTQRPFRNMLFQMIRAKTAQTGNALLIASGYFTKSIPAWRDDPEVRSIASEITDYIAGGTLYTFGPPRDQDKKPCEDPYWQHHDFAKRLAKELNGSVSYRQFVAQSHWHAKIAIRYSDTRPIAAIIGSSNMTIAATIPKTGIFNPDSWNIESDALIWADRSLDRLLMQTDESPFDAGISFTGGEFARDELQTITNREVRDTADQLAELSEKIRGTADEVTANFLNQIKPEDNA